MVELNSLNVHPPFIHVYVYPSASITLTLYYLICLLSSPAYSYQN